MKHIIKLSNGQELIAEEGEDCLYLGMTDTEENPENLKERWLVNITTNGITVWQAGNFAKRLVKNLHEPLPPEDDTLC